jgi:RNA polymerase sigma-70 factor (ECF subfamily)
VTAAATDLGPALVAAFARGYTGGTPEHAVAGRDAALEVALHAALVAARAAWPAVALDAEEFASHLGSRTPAGEPPSRAVAALHAADLYLACATLRGDGAALSALEAQFFPEIAGVIVKRHGSPALADEVQQALRVQLVIGAAGHPPALATYAGRGPLRSWLLVAAARAAIRLARARDREAPIGDDRLLALAAAERDPDLHAIKTRYRAQFQAAFAGALAALSGRDRTLLRLHVIEELGIDRIGAIYGVHRATAARWLERARAALLAGTRRTLMRELRVDRWELDSIIRLIRSRIEISIGPLLGTGGGGAS